MWASICLQVPPTTPHPRSCGDWLLLGRKASWDAGRYSCLAGFAEVGETLEQAVAREVLEEAGMSRLLGHRRLGHGADGQAGCI